MLKRMFDSDFGHVIAAQKKFRFWETVSKDLK